MLRIENLSVHYGMIQAVHCLLYTSDAADEL